MKRLAPAIRLASAALALGFSAAAVAAAPQEAAIAVDGLDCPTCPYIAGQAMEKVDSVEIVDAVMDWDAERATYLVRFDDAVADTDALIAAVGRYGYSATVATEADLAAAGF